MSYILDALNKSEQERQQREHGVSLQPLTGMPHDKDSATRWLPLAAVAIVIAAAGVFAGVYFSMQQNVAVTQNSAPVAPTTAAPPAFPAATVPATAPVPAVVPATVPAVVPATTPKVAATVTTISALPRRNTGSNDSVKSLYRQKGMSTEQAMAQSVADEALARQTGTNDAAPAVNGAAVTGDAVKTFADDEAAFVRTQEAAQAARSAVDQKARDLDAARKREAALMARVQAELEQIQAQDGAATAAKQAAMAKQEAMARQEAARVAAPKAVEPVPEADNVPLATQLSADLQRRIPNIDFGAHVYAGKTNNGFVILNGKKRYTGDTVAPGLTVERITEDGVILDMGGTRFKLGSMSNWIN